MSKFASIISYIIVIAFSLFSLTGCSSNSSEMYQSYVKSLISINYLGATKDYIDATGANEEDAKALYDANAELLANNLITYYNLHVTNTTEDIKAQFVELAKNIYSKANYSVGEAYKKDGVYYVDVTVYPMDFFNQSLPAVTEYVNTFNTAVTNGSYNDYTLEQYETEFATGFLELLNNECINMTYADPVLVSVEIQENKDTYFISHEDFLSIDSVMINTNQTTATPTDAVPEATGTEAE